MLAADLPVVAELARQSMDGAWSFDQLADELKIGYGLQLVVEENHELCGYIMFRQVKSEAELLQLAVLPVYRRRGLASGLLDSGIQQLCSRQARVLFLEVRRNNQSARFFYEQAGFSRIGIRKRYYSRPVDDAVVMKRVVRNGGQYGKK